MLHHSHNIECKIWKTTYIRYIANYISGSTLIETDDLHVHVYSRCIRQLRYVILTRDKQRDQLHCRRAA